MSLFFRFLLRFLLRVLYGYKVFGGECLKTKGPVILTVNHSSWLDGLFLYASLGTDWQFVTSSPTAKLSWLHKKFVYNKWTVPIEPASAFELKRLAEILSKGGKLVIFAEKTISTNGELMKTQAGIHFLIQKTNAKLILGYLRGARYIKGAVCHPGNCCYFPRVGLYLKNCEDMNGNLHSPSQNKENHIMTENRRAIWLRDRMLAHHREVNLEYGPQTLPHVVRYMCRMARKVCIWEDFKFTKITYRKLILGASLIGGVLKKTLKPSEDGRVGFLLPGVAAAPVVLLALWSIGKVPTILNFSAGIKTICDCTRLSKIKQVVTSRSFIEQIHFDVKALADIGVEMVYLEDVRPQISLFAKIKNLIFCKCPIPKGITAQSTAVILFTSGSEGMPKGVELTHRNLIANCEQAVPFANVADSYKIFNALPIFHGFGLMLGVIIPIVRGIRCFIYPSPLHYKIVPGLVYDTKSTVIASTNTFLNGYAHYAQPSDFSSIRLSIVGGEKLQPSTIKNYADRFMTLVEEGYGVTECSPIISVNTTYDYKPGSVGRPFPGMQVQLKEVPGIANGGRLLVKGPNVMKGYLNKEANDAFKALNGWYDTGDIATIDEDGFITILGRVKRFAKISGEMISLTAVEDTLKEALIELGSELELAVSSVHCEDRGEALVVVTNDKRVTDEKVRAIIRESGLSNLCTPRNVMLMDALPRLGSGKIDYMTLKNVLEESSAQS
ncbi:MAG: AMP-binding protein [Verrucomicrobia bacterium]|nr:AMP-binding protein [Verrucomicrobiota bacterium]